MTFKNLRSGYWQVILEKVIPAWQLCIAIATRHPQNQIPKYPEYRPHSRYYMVGRNYQITLTSCKLQCKTVPHWSRFWKYELCSMLQDLSFFIQIYIFTYSYYLQNWCQFIQFHWWSLDPHKVLRFHRETLEGMWQGCLAWRNKKYKKYCLKI